MTTGARLKSAAEFLAGEALMGWRDHKLLDVVWTDGKGFCIRKDRWKPYADTPEGLRQCLGKGGIVEKMRHVGWDFLAATWADYPYNLNPDRPEGAYQAIFWKTKVDFSKKEAFNDILGAAITLAAATALGWKEE